VTGLHVRSLAAIVAKDLRLLLRDRAALVFIAVAPIVVICVAGFSLAALYGADPTGQTGYDLPIVDEDGGGLARQIEEQLARETSVKVRRVATREAAERLVAQKIAGSALVIPAGTSAALAAGQPARVLLYADPVKYLERLNVRLRVLQVRDQLADAERARVAADLEQKREALREQLARLAAAVSGLRGEISAAERSADEQRARASEAFDAEAKRLRDDVARQVDEQLRALASQVDAQIAARYEELRTPARAYLGSLADARRDFTAWFEELKRLAARRADEIPPPPQFPEPPAELTRLLDAPPAPLELPAHLDIRVAPRVAEPAATPAPALDVALPSLEVPDAPPPGASLAVEEVGVGGGPNKINTFDQNVPGFSVTFLLLGMLLGVSLGLLDERGWGTLDRVRALPVYAGNILIGKLASRFVVGVVQMLLLFAAGYLLFGISLGPQPWALLLPIGGIAFAGTAFGLVVAGLARSRDAVLPLGSIAIVTMAAVGGCWWPIDLEPRWMRAVALAFPTTWAMEAFNDLMIRWRGAEAALRPTAVLAAYGVGYLAIGLLLFRRRLARG
jgi:ABC-type Na+ efflux pump permease subunit